MSVLTLDVFDFSAVFKLAEKDVGCVFAKTGEVNIEKIKCSKYFQALLQKSKGHAAEQMVQFNLCC